MHLSEFAQDSHYRNVLQVPPFQEVDVFETGEAFELRNGYVRASFDKDGMLQAVTTIDDGKTTKTKLQGY